LRESLIQFLSIKIFAFENYSVSILDAILIVPIVIADVLTIGIFTRILMKLNDLYVVNGEEMPGGNLKNNIEEACKYLLNGLESMDMGRKMRLCRNLIEKVVVKKHDVKIHYKFPVSSNFNKKRECQTFQGSRFYSRTYNAHPTKAQATEGSPVDTLSGIMGCIPADRKGRRIKMEVLQDLLTDPKPLETYSLWGLLMNIRKQYQAEPQGRAGHVLSKRCIRSIQWYVQNVLIKCRRCCKVRIVAVITDPSEVIKILGCLKRNHAPPFDKIATKAS